MLRQKKRIFLITLRGCLCTHSLLPCLAQLHIAWPSARPRVGYPRHAGCCDAGCYRHAASRHLLVVAFAAASNFIRGFPSCPPQAHRREICSSVPRVEGLRDEYAMSAYIPTNHSRQITLQLAAAGDHIYEQTNITSLCRGRHNPSKYALIYPASPCRILWILKGGLFGYWHLLSCLRSA